MNLLTQFIYFDVGGVLLLDYSGTNKWVEMKRDLGVSADLDSKFDDIWKRYRSQICIDCDVDTLVPLFEKEVGITIPEKYSMLADFVNRFEVNKNIWKIAQKAKEKYRVGLLTNQFPRMLDLVQENKLIPDIEWDVVIDSSVVGYQKPEDDIFEIAEKATNHDPESILLIDNGSKNLEGAKKRGWNTLLYDPQNLVDSNNKIIDVLMLK